MFMLSLGSQPVSVLTAVYRDQVNSVGRFCNERKPMMNAM